MSQEFISVEPQSIPGLTEGRIVHYVLEDNQHRPAMIVRVWDHGTGMSNLQVFTDGSNDKSADQGLIWRGSIFYSADKLPGTWHWIEKA